MCYKNDVDEIVGKIKNYNKITDLFIVYNMDRKVFIINDKKEEKLIKSFFNFSLTKFKQFLSELNKMDLWKSDYEMEFKITKY